MGASYRLRAASDAPPLPTAPPSAPAILGRHGRGVRPAVPPPSGVAAAAPDAEADPGDPTTPLRGVLIAILLAVPFWLGLAFWVLGRAG